MKRRSSASSSPRRVPSRSNAPTLPWHSLAGKHIWVTGGAGHLGSPITQALDQAGAQVLCIDLGERADALIRSAGLKNTQAASWTANHADDIAPEITRLSRKHGAPDGL